MSLGVAAAQITTKGVGSDFPQLARTAMRQAPCSPGPRR